MVEILSTVETISMVETNLSRLVWIDMGKYFYSLIYTVSVGTYKETAESKNRVNRGCLVVLKGRKIAKQVKNIIQCMVDYFLIHHHLAKQGMPVF